MRFRSAFGIDFVEYLPDDVKAGYHVGPGIPEKDSDCLSHFGFQRVLLG
jgi:hypothetical protein